MQTATFWFYPYVPEAVLWPSSSAYWCPHCWGTDLLYGSYIRRTGHTDIDTGQNRSRGPSADWWVLMPTNASGTISLTCLPKHGGARYNSFGHPSNDWPTLLNFRDFRSAPTAGPLSSSDRKYSIIIILKINLHALEKFDSIRPLSTLLNFRNYRPYTKPSNSSSCTTAVTILISWRKLNKYSKHLHSWLSSPK
jgi:hypothetical protein